MRIGIMGAPIESENLGCMALTYSVLLILEEIADKNNLSFQYLIFDGYSDEKKIDEMATTLKIKKDKIIYGHMVMLSNPLRILKHIKNTMLMIKEISSCDCVIDITEGDSFSDIYGAVTFKGRTNVKDLVKRLRKPLLLAPQTYGPYQKKRHLDMAAKVIKQADCVLVRDKMSQKLIKDMTGRDTIFTTDLAFVLPYDKKIKTGQDILKIGINASELLSATGTEIRQKNFLLSVDYTTYIEQILEKLLQKQNVEIHMIPHVALDDKFHRRLKEKFSQINIVKPMKNPIEIKNYISEMDVFIGARMHGTVAAFTSGVATIPTAYSMKFAGLFQSIDYNYLVDLQTMATDEAVIKTLEYVENYKELRQDVADCKEKYVRYVELIKLTIEEWLLKIDL
jgi:Uncharacterized conserved protein